MAVALVVWLVTTSAFRCLGTETTGFSGTLVPLSFMKFGTIRRTKATLWYKNMKRICRARFPIKTMIVSERESLIGTSDSSLSINAGLKDFISEVIGFAMASSDSVDNFRFE